MASYGFYAGIIAFDWGYISFGEKLPELSINNWVYQRFAIAFRSSKMHSRAILNHLVFSLMECTSQKDIFLT